MKISIELDEAEQMEIAEIISKKASSIADAAISNYFANITQDEFIRILRRSMRTSCDSFFQQYMQYYIEKRAPEILRKISDDLRRGVPSGGSDAE